MRYRYRNSYQRSAQAMITDTQARKAVRTAAASGRTITLTDPAPRGAGRLVLVARPDRAEWYAQRYADGRRRLQKLGAFPAMPVAEARERHGGVGRAIVERATVAELFDAYTAIAGREHP